MPSLCLPRRLGPTVRGFPLKKATEYRQHAQECRGLARASQTDEQRQQLLKLAETWEALAIERERMLREQRMAEDAFDALPVPAGQGDAVSRSL